MHTPTLRRLSVHTRVGGGCMSQNINLLGPAFRKRRQLLTLVTVAQCLGVTLVALFGYHFYLAAAGERPCRRAAHRGGTAPARSRATWRN